MVRTGRRKRLHGLPSVAAVVACLGLVTGCSALLKPPGEGTERVSSGTATRPAGAARRATGKPNETPACPELTDAKTVDQADWETLFDIDQPNARKLRTALVSALGVQSLSAKLDSDLKTACAGITKELGARGDTDTAETACASAARAINDARARLGKKARVSVVYGDPRCAFAADTIGACLAECKGGAAEETRAPVPVDCAETVSLGVCRGKCTGSCDVTDGMVCDGHCDGGCDWGFRGSCQGACVGTCNGRASRGFCRGRCVGQCNGLVKHGTCKGRCTGPCDLRRASACAGACTGRCSIPFTGLRCEAIPKGVEAEAACRTRCDAELPEGALCAPARLTVTIDHTKPLSRGRRLAETLQRHLPTILRIAVGMKSHATRAARSAQIALKAGEDLVNDAGTRGLPAAALPSCAAAPLREGLAAIGSVNVSVRLAVEVKAAADAADNAGGHSRG